MKSESKIYEEILNVSKELANVSKTQVRMEEELKHINIHLGKINGNVHDHCNRIKELENYKLKTKTTITVVTILVSLIWTVVIFIFK